MKHPIYFKLKVFGVSKILGLVAALFFSSLALFSCSESGHKLPILGPREVVNGDTVYHQIPDFAFVNQDSAVITQEFMKDKIYVADFFFTSCPTICPVMKTQMLRVYEKYKDNPRVRILSHTIDPRHDSVSVLKEYRNRLKVKGDTWQFVTGEQDKIYEIGEKSYMVTAQEDSTAVAEGGFIHSGAFLLVDSKRHIRGIFDGTKEEEVNKLLKAMDLLLKEEVKKEK